MKKNKTINLDRYCKKCGAKMDMRESSKEYNMETGKKKIFHVWRCPNKRSSIFGLFDFDGHDEYDDLPFDPMTL